MPILSVKRIIEMSLVEDVTSTLSDLWPLFPNAPCLSQDSSAFPITSVCPPVALSVCAEVLSEIRNLPMPVSKGIFSIWKDYSYDTIGRESYFVDTLIELLVTRFTLQWLSQTLPEKPELDSMRNSVFVKRRDGSSLPKRTTPSDFMQSLSVC